MKAIHKPRIAFRNGRWLFLVPTASVATIDPAMAQDLDNAVRYYVNRQNSKLIINEGWAHIWEKVHQSSIVKWNGL